MTSSNQNSIDRLANSARRVLFASLIGTTIEFFDFFIYATAAVIVFPRLFFPPSDPFAATMQSLATFSLAFLARPIGSALFGHFGDRVGRKATLVAALLTMGLSTVCIGLLPTYASVGVLAPCLLALCRLGQGLGLGGEWGGAVLLATENAPPGKRAWYGMFPQLGAPISFFLSVAVFLLLADVMSEAAFLSYGWRIPFIASALLVVVGLFVRLHLQETPEFAQVMVSDVTVKIPIMTVIRQHMRSLVLGTFAALCAFVLFYLMTVFTLSWGTSKLGFSRSGFLQLQLVAVVFFGLTVPLGALAAQRHGCARATIAASSAIAVFGILLPPMFGSGNATTVALFLALGMGLMGLTYGPLGTLLSQLFPVEVRYTGASLAFNGAGILGASLAAYAATWLASNYGLAFVGYYLTVAALISVVALVLIGRRGQVGGR